MADFILVHRAATGDEYLLNRDHLIYARRDPTGGAGSMIKLVGGESFAINEDLETLGMAFSN